MNLSKYHTSWKFHSWISSLGCPKKNTDSSPFPTDRCMASPCNSVGSSPPGWQGDTHSQSQSRCRPRCPVATWDKSVFLAKKNPPSLPSSFLVWERCQVPLKKISKSGHWDIAIRPKLDEFGRIAISRKRHFRSPKRKNENTLQ